MVFIFDRKHIIFGSSLLQNFGFCRVNTESFWVRCSDSYVLFVCFWKEEKKFSARRIQFWRDDIQVIRLFFIFFNVIGWDPGRSEQQWTIIFIWCFAWQLWESSSFTSSYFLFSSSFFRHHHYEATVTFPVSSSISACLRPSYAPLVTWCSILSLLMIMDKTRCQ